MSLLAKMISGDVLKPEIPYFGVLLKTKIMKQRLMLIAAFTMASAALVNGQTKLVEKVTKQGSEIVIPYEKYVLPNGLTLIVHEDHSDPVVHVDVTYHFPAQWDPKLGIHVT